MCIDSPATYDLKHDRIEGQPVGVVDILVSGQTTEHRLPEQPIELMDGVLACAGVAQCRSRQIRQPECVVKLAHYQETAI